MKPETLDKTLARLDRIVQVNASDQQSLNQEFIEQAANYSWLSSYYADAKDRVRRLKNKLEQTRADMREQARRQHAGKKVVKDVIEDFVTLSKAYQQDLRELLDAQYVEDRLTGGMKALEIK